MWWECDKKSDKGIIKKTIGDNYVKYSRKVYTVMKKREDSFIKCYSLII